MVLYTMDEFIFPWAVTNGSGVFVRLISASNLCYLSKLIGIARMQW
jgi:hypothetical protein